MPVGSTTTQTTMFRNPIKCLNLFSLTRFDMASSAIKLVAFKHVGEAEVRKYCDTLDVIVSLTSYPHGL
jgi:hypothetical protein